MYTSLLDIEPIGAGFNYLSVNHCYPELIYKFKNVTLFYLGEESTSTLPIISNH